MLKPVQMPLNFQTQINKGELCTWQIGEPENWFRERLQLVPAEAAELEQIKGKRRLEWLACRWLTHHILCDLKLSNDYHRIPVLKDEFGKPHLKETPFDVSFSHSHGRVAVLLQPVACGVDIQFFVPKIQRIAHKFLSVREAESLDTANLLEHLHFYWSAKEAVYKAWGRKALEFREHIIVEPFKYGEAGSTPVQVVKDGERNSYQVEMLRQGDYFLAWCRETTGDLPFQQLNPLHRT